MKPLSEYRLILWDLDGTLYFQKEFRKKMALVLLQELCLKPNRWKELLVILKYRKIREDWDPKDTGAHLEERQYLETGKKMSMEPERVKEIIHCWMHKKPLEHLYPYRDERAVLLIEELKKKGCIVTVYSDYPTKEKLEALQILVEESFSSADEEISSMKPNPKGLNYIIEHYGVKKEEVLMIGDRMEKDGEAAIAAGVDYWILSRDRKKRQEQYQNVI